mmetsp:Transcript_11567/g.26377  ORF Transcript_11567/g.26377 Transcript_11567/m.26377 type:complete len:204 (+) Transcript_11567:88-699(+)
MACSSAAASAVLAALVAVTLQGCSNPVELRCSAGPVGSCATSFCYPTRGPTQCIGNACMCATGYCEYGSANKRCRAQVPDSTCTVSHMCWKGGLVSATCVDGHCLCRSNMHVGPDGTCHAGWWPRESSLAASNATVLATEADPEEDREVVMNVAMALVWFTLPASLAVAAVLHTKRWLGRARSVDPEASNPYAKLLDASAPVA